ncbi:PREDICTED: protein LURP-one-related 8-like [Nelumbo nucifera]|uniref:Protein LURP-one-related 8-like n=2 Tax=Nelumbo nucifera TaxID=4432 RepID=A0A1U8AG82_NELNU|nr:PREDICTED: protein LURP-one-related 8-like [Nelumbo nucifera]DAD19060.1 TPA_asm: hypothetical protein HUJ06_020523 [Nelumbo nucifera]
MIVLSRCHTSKAVEVRNMDGGGDGKYEREGVCKSLTVWRKSLLFSCNGFTVIDSDGKLVFRVDNYMDGHREEILLMDGSGNPLLTMRRKKLMTFVENWLIFEGEGSEEVCRSRSAKKKPTPIFCVRKHMNLLSSNSSVLAHVFTGSSSSNTRFLYVIEGSYCQRSCQVLDESRKVMAEIKRKEAMSQGGRGGISFGVDVFLLIVRSDFNPGLAMSLVLLLDQMFS